MLLQAMLLQAVLLQAMLLQAMLLQAMLLNFKLQTTLERSTGLPPRTCPTMTLKACTMTQGTHGSTWMLSTNWIQQSTLILAMGDLTLIAATRGDQSVGWHLRKSYQRRTAFDSLTAGLLTCEQPDGIQRKTHALKAPIGGIPTSRGWTAAWSTGGWAPTRL